MKNENLFLILTIILFVMSIVMILLEKVMLIVPNVKVLNMERGWPEDFYN